MRKYTKTYRKEELKFGNLFTFYNDEAEVVKVEREARNYMDNTLENLSYKKSCNVSKAWRVLLKHQNSFLHTFCFIVEEEVEEGMHYAEKQRRYLHVIYPNGNFEGFGYAKMSDAIDHALEAAMWNTYSKSE